MIIIAQDDLCFYFVTAVAITVIKLFACLLIYLIIYVLASPNP